MPASRSSARPRRRCASRRLNMDVPISLGVTLATAMSLFQTTRGSEQVYFDAAVTLLFFLLVGRYPRPAHARARAPAPPPTCSACAARAATVIQPDGSTRAPRRARAAARHARPDRGGRALRRRRPRGRGHGEVDESLITGETVPRAGRARRARLRRHRQPVGIDRRSRRPPPTTTRCSPRSPA